MTDIQPQLRSQLAQKLLYLDGQPFSLYDYPFYTAIYDGEYVGLLLKCGRQIAKCVYYQTLISLENGSVKPICDIQINDRVVGLAQDTSHTDISHVTWKSDQYLKPCIRITTRQGHQSIMALTHPVRQWDRWTPAGDLKEGDRLAVVRQCGIFTAKTEIEDDYIKLAAYMIAEGQCNGSPKFTQNFGKVLDEFVDVCRRHNFWFMTYDNATSNAITLGFIQDNEGNENPIKLLLKEWGIYGKDSQTLHVPDWVWDLDQCQTALFINRLWAGDGSCGYCNPGFNFEYSSTSKQLTSDVQRLLWKFGIPSSIHAYVPTVYEDTEKKAYKLRIETQPGINRFITYVGAFNKTDNMCLLDQKENSNRDTYPIEIENNIQETHQSHLEYQRRGRFVPQPSLRSKGLRLKLQYPLSRAKFKRYVDFFSADNKFDTTLVEKLAVHEDTDLFWDEIESIEDLGEQPCHDITVDKLNSFVADAFVTHNSTTLCNFTICESVGIPHFKTLFVSPSQEQTQRFSNTRLGKVVHYSPLVRKHWVTNAFTDRTMLRMFRNGSEVTLTYACDDPDRARGPSSDRNCFDEVQDILYDEVIPVINESMANSEYAYETYAGTPKTMDNTMEFLWSHSTQTEWIMKCEGCNRYNFIDSIRSIGKTGPICIKCGHALNPRKGCWYDFNPGKRIKGFHISQPMLPRNTEQPKRWARLLDKLEKYSETKIKNEILGVSDALGARLISKEELEDLCQDYAIHRKPHDEIRQSCNNVVAGIDWSGGGTEGVSRTVLWIFGITPEHRLKTLYFRIYPVTNPVSIIDDVVDVINGYGVQLVFGDRGEGHLANNLLRQALGRHRVSQLRYGHQGSALTYNEAAECYQGDRTTLMDNYFMVLKRGGVIYPRLSFMTEPIRDTLNIYEEVTQTGQKVWRHAPSQPDDSFHAQLLAWLAAKIILMDLTFNG